MQTMRRHRKALTRDQAVEDAALGAGVVVVDVGEAALRVDRVPDALCRLPLQHYGNTALLLLAALQCIGSYL